MSKTLAISAAIVIGILVIAFCILTAIVLAERSNAQTENSKTVVVTGRPGTHYSGVIFSDERKDITGTVAEIPTEYPVSGSGPVGAAMNRTDPEGALVVKLYDASGDLQDAASATSKAPVAVYR